MRAAFSLCMAALALGLSPAALAAERGATKNGTAIMQRSHAAITAHDEKTEERMTLVAADGTVEQVRSFVIYYKREHGEERTLQKFLSPPVLAGTGLLIVDTGNPDTDIWLYLPTSRRIRRIAGHDKSGRYMGTEFSYEDLEGYRIAQHRFTYVGEGRTADGRECDVVDAVPASPSGVSASGYSKMRYWIDRRTLYPARIEYFAKDGRLEKVLSVQDMHVVGHYWRPMREIMKNLVSGRITRLEVQTDETDFPLQDFYVSQRFLRSD